ncbi:hypothetical protein AKJ52_01190, partial [candidate division MSBL1 archaeon SCGC-AAA382C18]
MLKKQEKLIQTTNWDYLIILDACRFDYFEQLYENYLEGKLRKVESPGSQTWGWFTGSFDKYYEDTVYISSQPGINSQQETDYKASEKFYNIIDVWDWGWDDRLETVPPKKVNVGFKKAEAKHPDKRKVIHYIQPHAPHIGEKTEVNQKKEGNFRDFLLSLTNREMLKWRI